jgi:hypothetical protein
MPKVYLYFPFTNYKEDKTLAKDVTNLRDKGVQFELLERVGAKPLQVVEDDDLLMIAAHGDLAVNVLACYAGQSEETLTANDLADQLEKGGLPKTHQSILLLTCFASGAHVWDQRAKTGYFANRDETCLSSIVAKSLAKRRYFSILVGGYAGMWSSACYQLNGAPPGVTTHLKNSRSRSWLNSPADLDRIIWFDAWGKATGKA